MRLLKWCVVYYISSLDQFYPLTFHIMLIQPYLILLQEQSLLDALQSSKLEDNH